MVSRAGLLKAARCGLAVHGDRRARSGERAPTHTSLLRHDSRGGFHLLQDCTDFIVKPRESHVHPSELPATSFALALRLRGCSSTWPYIYGRPHVDMRQPDGWRMEHTVAGQLELGSKPA
jgi:hypothetical protein